MKTEVIKSVVAFVFLSLSCVSFAESWTDSNGVEWSYSIYDGNKVCIDGIPETTAGSVTVPSSIGGNAVKKIGVNAFISCTALEGVVVQSGVVEIGMQAFFFLQKIEFGFVAVHSYDHWVKSVSMVRRIDGDNNPRGGQER